MLESLDSVSRIIGKISLLSAICGASLGQRGPGAAFLTERWTLISDTSQHRQHASQSPPETVRGQNKAGGDPNLKVWHQNKIWVLKFSLPVISIGNCVWSCEVYQVLGWSLWEQGRVQLENPDPLLSPCYHPSPSDIIMRSLISGTSQSETEIRKLFMRDKHLSSIHVVSLCNRSPWDADVTRIIIMRVNYWCVALLQVVSAIKFTNEESVEKKIWKAEILDKSLTRHCSSPTDELATFTVVGCQLF